MWARLLALSGLWLVATASTTDANEAAAVIDLREAVTRTLERNPALVVAALQIEARRGQLIQSGLRPNPELGVLVENVVGADAAGNPRNDKTRNAQDDHKNDQQSENAPAAALGQLAAALQAIQYARPFDDNDGNNDKQGDHEDQSGNDD